MNIIRLYRSRYSPKDATGAKLRGGRWNSPGHPVLYASSTRALACLEVLVHIRDMSLVPDDYTFCEIKVPDALISPWDLTGEAALAKIESPVLSREFGDEWLRQTTVTTAWGSRRKWTSVRAVPSVIIPQEMNYLINPEHPQFDQLTWGEPESFRFDPRLTGSSAME